MRILLRLFPCPSPTPMRSRTLNIGRLGFGAFVQVDYLRLVPNLGWNPRDDTQITCTVCRLYAQVACSGSRFSLMWARPPAARS